MWQEAGDFQIRPVLRREGGRREKEEEVKGSWEGGERREGRRKRGKEGRKEREEERDGRRERDGGEEREGGERGMLQCKAWSDFRRIIYSNHSTPSSHNSYSTLCDVDSNYIYPCMHSYLSQACR